jgi:hypothetical protein
MHKYNNRDHSMLTVLAVENLDEASHDSGRSTSSRVPRGEAERNHPAAAGGLVPGRA